MWNYKDKLEKNYSKKKPGKYVVAGTHHDLENLSSRL